MAGLGQFAKPGCLMRAFLFMAAVTGARGFTIFLPGLMATVALHPFVLSFEFKVSQVVIKCQLVQLDDIYIFALVIGMTDTALL